MRRPQQERQRAGPGAVRHDQAHPLVIKIGAGERPRDESGDLVAGELLADTAHDVRPRRIARIRAVVHRCLCRCRGRHACILYLSAGHTSTVASTAAAGQDRLVRRPKVIMTVDPVAAQAHGSVVIRSAEAKIGSLVIG